LYACSCCLPGGAPSQKGLHKQLALFRMIYIYILIRSNISCPCLFWLKSN
jgi:hypothetical protein